jgi:YgiT-type zinc finger domain-containing protein
MEHQVNCHYCGGVESVEATTTLFCDYRSATPVIVENVPAYVCELCGDTSFSGETVATLNTIDNGTSRPVGRRSFPVFDFERREGTGLFDGGSGRIRPLTDVNR